MGAIIWLLSLKPLLSAYFEKPSDLTARLSRKFRDLRKCLIVFFFFQDLQKEGEYFLFLIIMFDGTDDVKKKDGE